MQKQADLSLRSLFCLFIFFWGGGGGGFTQVLLYTYKKFITISAPTNILLNKGAVGNMVHGFLRSVCLLLTAISQEKSYTLSVTCQILLQYTVNSAPD